jgi:hypothetical protein
MNRTLSKIVIASVAIAAVIFGGTRLNGHDVISRASAQHGPNSEPAQVRAELENESFLVLRIRMAPHEQTGMHDLSTRLVIWLTNAHLRDTRPDGTTTDYRRTAGAIDWIPAQRHAGENLSDQPIEFLAVVPKSNASAVR